jgi:phosphoribosylformylglycinamidine synthase
MWAAKLPGEGAALYDACTAMCEVMSELGIAVDGGKDSLSMAARVDGDIVKAPGMYILHINRTFGWWGAICSCLTLQQT